MQDFQPPLQAQAQGGFCQDGNTEVHGRAIHYKVCAYFSGFYRLRYKCRATDVATGISVEVKEFKSGQGAVEHAIQLLIQTLVERGIISPPQ